MVRLERALSDCPIALLTGPAGVGKTELACEFGRRQGAKGNWPGGVVFTPFEYGAGLSRVLHEIGTTLAGISFARQPLEDQRQRVLDYLNRKPTLLIWDGFENVFDYLDSAECRELLEFLRETGEGAGCILLTSRGTGWADNAKIRYWHEELGGLNDPDSGRLAKAILDDSGRGLEAQDPEFPELLGLLQGNPLALRVVLPHLKGRTPAQVARALRRPTQEGALASTMMDAAIACSYRCMSARTRKHLPFLAVFRQRVLLDVLTFMAQGESYTSIMGESMGWGACRTYLREARDCGLLDSVSPSVYIIPPQVSRYLHQRLRRRLTAGQIAGLEEEFLRVYAGLGEHFLENLSSENSESAVTGVLTEEANLLRALYLAEKGGQWESAQLVLQPLGQVYKLQKRILELRRLRGRLLGHLGLEGQQAKGKGATDLWIYLRGTEITDAMDRQELDSAEAACFAVLRYLQPLGDRSVQPQIGSVYHQLGRIAQGRDQFEEAEGWYRKALGINESLGSGGECADSYHQLGLIDRSRHRYEEAEEWHRKALQIREQLEDEAEAAKECHELALIAEARQRFEDAVQWHHRAREAYERAGDQASAAAVYHRLGLIAQVKYDYEEAIGWYHRALLVYEDLEDELSGANDYYQLGVIALHRYESGEAEEWLGQALEAYESTENQSAVANCCHQMGVAAHAQGRHQEAEERYQKALDLFVGLDDDVAAASTWGQLGLLADQRGKYPDAVWYVAHTFELSTQHQLPLLRQARAHLTSLRSKMGTEDFLRCWQGVSDTDVLSQLG